MTASDYNLVNNYAAKYDTLTDAEATAGLKEKMAIESERADLQVHEEDCEDLVAEEGPTLCAASRRESNLPCAARSTA